MAYLKYFFPKDPENLNHGGTVILHRDLATRSLQGIQDMGAELIANIQTSPSWYNAQPEVVTVQYYVGNGHEGQIGVELRIPAGIQPPEGYTVRTDAKAHEAFPRASYR